MNEKFSFEEIDNGIESSGGLKGKYIPSDDFDNDTPETRDPKRFRVKGKFGKTLKFFREMNSYAKIENFKLPEKSDTLYTLNA